MKCGSFPIRPRLARRPPGALRCASGLTGRPSLDSRSVVRPPWLPAEIGRALADIGAPAYILDDNGVTRWLNARAIDAVSTSRPPWRRRPQATARVEFAKKLLRTARTSNFELVELLRSGEQVSVEIHSPRSRKAGASSASSGSSTSTARAAGHGNRRAQTSRRASTKCCVCWREDPPLHRSQNR